MQFNTLRKSILKYVELNPASFTDDGPIVIGFAPLSEEEITSQYKEHKFELLHGIEVSPSSDSLRNEFKMELQNQKELLQEKLNEIGSFKSPANSLLIKNKIALCEDIIHVLENISGSQTCTKIPMKLSVRELALWIYGHQDTIFQNMDSGKILEHIQNHYLYYNERDGKYCEINLNTLRKEFSVVKGSYSCRFMESNPIEGAEAKMEIVLQKIRSRYAEEAKV